MGSTPVRFLSLNYNREKGDESGLKGPELSLTPYLFGSFGSFGKKWVLIINELGSIFSTTMSIFNDNSVNFARQLCQPPPDRGPQRDLNRTCQGVPSVSLFSNTQTPKIIFYNED